MVISQNKYQPVFRLNIFQQLGHSPILLIEEGNICGHWLHPGHSLQGHWHRCINTHTGLPPTSLSLVSPSPWLKSLCWEPQLTQLGSLHTQGCAVGAGDAAKRRTSHGLNFKWVISWTFLQTRKFWRFSSPYSILATHLSLACQIWACSSEHVKEYVTTSIWSQHYWRMRYINTKYHESEITSSVSLAWVLSHYVPGSCENPRSFMCKVATEHAHMLLVF